MKRSILSAITILSLCCTVAACDDSDSDSRASVVSVGPSAFRNEADFVGLDSSVLVRNSVPQFSCPSIEPFSVPFGVNIRAGTSPITFTQLSIQATDPFRSFSPPTIFDSSSLTRTFGTLSVDSFDARTFAFKHSFGCGLSGNIVLNVSVTTVDINGTPRVTPLQVPVR
jgi:hypothetical protein